jgi:uncharacterized membrane protein (UPF0127 family)
MRGPYQLRTAGGRVVAKRVWVATNPWDNFRGLMLRARLDPEEGLLLKDRQIHMFFMRFAIDAAFLDREGRVVRMLAPIRPWGISPMVWRGREVVELAAGTLRRSEVNVGDRLVLEAPSPTEGG